MPDLPRRLCAGGCGASVRRGRCPHCSRARGRRRQTATERGYGPDWIRFRRAFLSALVEAGIVPVCGAALPGGPTNAGRTGPHSACRARGLLTFASLDGASLHLDHEPPLTDAERDDPTTVCDLRRVQLLCAACHARKDDPGRRGRLLNEAVSRG